MTSPEYQAPTWVNEDDPAFIEGVSPDLGAGYLNQLSGAVEDHGQRLGAITPVVTNLQNTALDQATGDNRYILQTVAGTFAQAEATTTALATKAAAADVVSQGQRLGAVESDVTTLQATALDQTTGDNRYILQTNAAGFATDSELATALATKAAAADVVSLNGRVNGLETAPPAHAHTIGDITAPGTRDDTTFLRGDGTWTQPPGTGASVDAHDYGLRETAAASANTAALVAAAAAIPPTGGTLLLRPGSYTTNPVTITGVNGLNIVGAGAVLNCASGNPLTLQGSRTAVTTVTTSITASSNQIVVASGAALTAGDLIIIRSGSEVFDPERPTQYYKGELAWIQGVSGTTVTLESRTYDSYSVSGHTVSIDKLTPIRDVTVRGLKVVGGGTGGTQTGMQAFHFDGATFEDCTVEDCEQVGIVGRIGTGLTIRNNRITRSDQTGLGYGVRAIGVDHGHIDGNIGRRNRHTVDVDYEVVVSRNIAVTGNHAAGDTSAGISTHGGAERITVEGNFTSNCGGGLVIRSGRTRVAGNHVKGTRTQAEASASYVHGIVIGDDSPNLWGVGVAGTGLQVVDNLVDIAHPALDGATTFGIFSTVALKDAAITGNRLSGFATYGIYLKGDTIDGALIADNHLDCTSQVGTPGVTFANGIFIEPGHGTVSGNNQKHLQIARNHIYGALYSAIRIVGNVDAAAPSDDVTVVDNILSGYGLRAVDMASYFKHGRVDRNLYPDDGPNRFVYNAANWSIPPDVGPSAAAGLLATGEETREREMASASSSAHPGTGIMWLTYFTARKTETCANIRLVGGNTAAGATPTLARVGMYEVAADGSLTLVASTANDTTLFSASFASTTKAWTSSFTKVAGKRYAIGILIVSGAAMPTLYGNSGSSGELGRAPMVCSQVSSLADLPSAVTAGSQSASGPGRWFLAAVTP